MELRLAQICLGSVSVSDSEVYDVSGCPELELAMALREETEGGLGVRFSDDVALPHCRLIIELATSSNRTIRLTASSGSSKKRGVLSPASSKLTF